MKEYVNAKVFLQGKLVEKNFAIANGKIYFQYDKAKCEQVDLQGKIVSHAFIDIHTHARIPGFSYKEDWEHLTSAALFGGYTKLVLMANVNPSPVDEKSYLQVMQEVNKIGVDILQVARATNGGKVTDFATLKKYTKIFSDDGLPIDSSQLMKEVLVQAQKHDVLVMLHEEDHSLKGFAYQSAFATKFNIPSFGPEYESKIVERDIELNKQINARIHLQHLSVASSLEYYLQAKKAGMRISAEVSPHHIFFNNEELENHGNYRMNPPIGSKQDQAALIAAIKNKLIDVIATDHAPHSSEEKDTEFAKSLNGVIGLETAFAAVRTKLGHANIETILHCLTTGPAKLIGESGEIEEGKDANIVIINPNIKWIFTTNNIKSKSHNSPWINKTLIGKVEQVIYKNKEIKN